MNQDKSKDTPLVSVWMITYNHESFIAQAIESVLMQKTTFPFELIIGEDCSTDRTAEIVRDYVAKYPNIIKARLNYPNMGMIPNMVKTIQECTGKYIALLEGDDFWTDENKLQQQVDFLELNCDYVGIGHDVNCLIYDKFSEQPIKQEKKFIVQKIPINKLLIQNIIPTCSITFRNTNIEFPNTINSLCFGDWPLILLLSIKGHWGISNKKMAAYRIHEGGVWSNSKKSKKSKKFVK